MNKARALRLLAQDSDDLEVISAALQDAVTHIGDIQFERDARRLTIAFNRYCWEQDLGPARRVRAGFQLGCVMEVKARKLRREAKDAVLELLALTFDADEPPGGLVTFAFAAGGDLAVRVECIDAALADLSDPWPAPRRPSHQT